MAEAEVNETLLPSISALSNYKNKIARQAAYAVLKKHKKKLKKELSKARKNEEARLGNKVLKHVPHTLESLREKDETIAEELDEEIAYEEAVDPYAAYYTKSYRPKVLITTSDLPHSKTIAFVKEVCRMIPGSVAKWRQKTSVEALVKAASSRAFSDLIVLNEDRRRPNALLLIHLPEGPSAYFRLSNISLCKEIKRDYKEITEHRPEVMLNNFKTQLGRVISRMWGALFNQDPEFRGRRVCTFHNQRDYIFFRHHRYEFKNAKRVALRELGPRFTLKLQWLQEGAFTGDYEWALKRHEMETSRRRFFL